ncbi:MAG TPA: ABC transporter permease subunit [Candidatus Limnocylindria bacterium]|nr:ABC transporter permease subunit [Candidatus Limnocylindria bacterium]
MTLFRLALRVGRVGAIGAGAFGVVVGFAQPLAFSQLAGDTPVERAIFAQQMELLGRSLTYILPVPGDLGTMAGWVEWRALGPMPLVLAFWALMAATGAGRGDEERGLVEHWLSAGVSRGSYLASRIAAFLVLAAIVVSLIVGAAGVGAVVGGEPIPAEGLALHGLVLLALALCVYGISLFVAQVARTRRGAIRIGATVLLLLFLVDASARSGDAQTISWISPFWLYDQNHPLRPGGSIDLASTAGLLGAAAILIGAAWSAFVRRDLGASLLRSRARAGAEAVSPSRDPLLRIPIIALLEQQRWSVLVWMAAMAGLAAFLLSFTRAAVDAMLATPTFRVYLERAGLGTYTSFVGAVWLTTAVLLLALYAIFQASGWADDDAEGRLEIVLAQPVSRSRVVLERIAALLIGGALIVAASTLATLAATNAAGIELDTGRFVLASALTLAVIFAFGGLGAAGVSWRPRIAVIGLTAIAIWSYLVQELAPLFDWPTWVEDLSLFALYGQPLAQGIDWARLSMLTAIGLVGSGMALATMRRRDVGA